MHGEALRGRLSVEPVSRIPVLAADARFLHTGTNVDLHANSSLDKDGEAIGLFALDGVTPLSTVTFDP